MKDLQIISPVTQILLNLNKAYLDLTMKSKGKADLYFHSYFWQEYLRSLNDMQELACVEREEFNPIQIEVG